MWHLAETDVDMFMCNSKRSDVTRNVVKHMIAHDSNVNERNIIFTFL